MPWADQTRDDTAAFIGRAAEMWHAGSDFSYLVTRPHDIGSDEIEQLLGGCGLHARLGPGALEIGYWLRHDATGGGVMTAVARRLTAVAFALTDIDRVEIHCDQSNGRSAAIPQRLGYTLDRLVDQPIAAAGEQGRSMVWVTHRSPIPPASPAP